MPRRGIFLSYLPAFIIVILLSLFSAPIDAPDLQITDMYDFYEISLKWNAMKNDSATRGEVLGYRIRYWPILRNEFPVLPINVSFANVREPNRSLVIKNLTPYTTYGIAISAYTEGGFGVFSRHKLAGENLFTIEHF